MINTGLPPAAFQTWSLIRPNTEAYWRPATCEEAGCLRHRNGWRTVLDLTTREGLRWDEWIRIRSGRRFTRVKELMAVTFTFERGQTCFEKHRVAIEREPIFVVRDGDHRVIRNGRRRVHVNGVDWRDDMQENLVALAEDRRRG